MTKLNAEKLDILLFIVQNTRGKWLPDDVMEMYYYIEEELHPFEEAKPTPLSVISKETH